MEKVRSTVLPTRAVMPKPSGVQEACIDRYGSGACGSPEGDVHTYPETATARLFETEPPPYNRRFLEHRLAHRIQELAYGGLKPETIKRLKALAEDFDRGVAARRRQPAKDRPIAGTRLIREWQGVEHCVTVRDEDFEYQGRPYKSLSAIARAITGTRWNGLLFFGLKNQRASP